MNALEIEQLELTLPGTGRPVLDKVDLSIAAGETVALVGESGSGKTLTARTALRLLPNGAITAGSVRVAGRDVLQMDSKALRELRGGTAAMIFQEPRAAINPLRRVGDFLTEGVRASGKYTRRQAAGRAAQMLTAVGLTGAVACQFPAALSGGMLQRVMIAATLMGDPKLLLADEPTTALDVTTQAEVVALLGDVKERFGTGLLFVTHDLALASAISDRVYVMYAGRITETGTSAELFERPRHPYTRALLSSTPRLDSPHARLNAIQGQPPSLATALTGCAFAPRCAAATAICLEHAPAARPVAGQPAHMVACHHSEAR
ncbi:MAG TPA: ABC transporter ATP-binding protein [Streptosporangiaceae bacterium]|jgi:oligopeptide/dipeptide ABC transporter ATP-binding protein